MSSLVGVSLESRLQELPRLSKRVKGVVGRTQIALGVALGVEEALPPLDGLLVGSVGPGLMLLVTLTSS